MLALQALIGGMDKAAAVKERRIELAINGERVQELVIAPDQFDVPWSERPADSVRVGRSIREVERDLIQVTLDHCHGDKRAAAAMLGVSLKTLYNRLHEYAMELDKS